MGANNALRVYQGWGRPQGDRPALTDRALRLLTYMALVSMDSDKEPWCQVGHPVLAVMGLGLDMPDDDDKASGEALRKVRRMIEALTELGAIKCVQRATYGARGARHAKYRIYLDTAAPGTPLPSADNSIKPGIRKPRPKGRAKPPLAAVIGPRQEPGADPAIGQVLTETHRSTFDQTAKAP